MDETNHRGHTIVMAATATIDAVVGGLAATVGIGIGLTRVGSPQTARRIAPLSTRRDDHAMRPAARLGLRAIAAAVGLVLAGPFAVTTIAVATIAFRRALRILELRRSRRRIERDIPDALDLFVLLLDAGLPPRRCVDELARRGPEATRPGFAEVNDRLANGLPFAEAIVALRNRLGSSVVSLVDLVAASDRAGLPMSHVIHQMSAEARAARLRRDQAAARVLPVKLSFPLVVCTLPSFVLLAIAPAVMAALSSLGSDAW